MFCTNCGKKLYEGDRFCAYCGTKVREEEPKARQEIVFNPPFRAEAERRTSEIFKGFSETSEEPEKPRRTEPAHFDWNLDGFPSGESKKTEDVDFNWDSVMDRKRDARREEPRVIPAVPVVDKIQINGSKNTEEPAAELKPVQEEPADEKPVWEEPPKEETDEGTTSSLEDELFGKNYKPVASAEGELCSGNTAQLEKFYTYNEKKEAFQELLDKEYERLRSMEEERKPDAESLEFTWAGRLFPQQDEETENQLEAVPQQETASGDTIDFSPIREEAKLRSQMDRDPEQAVETEESEVSAAEEPEPEMIAAEEVKAEEPSAEEPVDEEPSVEEPSAEDPEDGDATPSHSQDEKLRLRYSDVFPRESLAAGSDDGTSGAAEPAAEDGKTAESKNQPMGTDISDIFDEDEEEKKGMNLFVKLIVALLVLLIVLEGIVLAAKFIAPESRFSIQANAFVEKILDKVTGGSDASQDGENPTEADGDSDADLPKETYLSGILRDKVPEPETIGQVLEDTELKYDNKKNYAFGEQLAEAEAFVDETWKTGEDGKTITKAEAMMNAVVTYFDQWKETNEDTSLIGINKLEIGEIRTGEEGYYVLCRLTFAGEDGGEAVKYVTVNVKESQDSMVINETKEETI
ncbi:MAG: zinc ribbon domain-containing protein [Anaerovoracaceae bacterium]